MDAVWLLGDAVVHVSAIILANNLSPNNAGPALYSDIATPRFTIALLMTVRRHALSQGAPAELRHGPS
jgi:uncharacterized protein DUF6790